MSIRRLSISSSGSSSPVLSSLDSSSALILVHDDDDDDNTRYDDDDTDALFEIGRPFVQPLEPSVVLLYLLSPFLKLGATLLPYTGLPLKLGLPALFLFAVLAAFIRRIWYMLARYTRKGDVEDIVLDSFARRRGRGKERLRSVLRSVVRGGTGALRVFLAALYIRESAEVLLPLLPSDLPFSPEPVLCIGIAVVVLPFCLAQSLASKRIVYCTGLSILTYILWLTLVAVAYHKGTLKTNPSWTKMGSLWQGITTIAFAFTSSTTLSLYASLKAGIPSVTTAKRPISHSFMPLSLISVAVAVLLTFPLMIFASPPSQLRIEEEFGYPLDPYIIFFNSLTLLLTVPSILVTLPSLPIPERVRQSTNVPLSKLAIFALTSLLSLVPATIFAVVSDVLLACCLSSTYILPAFLHIVIHYFKRPLSIIMPSTPSPYHRSGEDSPSSHDELLQRKERALQRSQTRKRIIWDMGVWVLLLPVGGGGFLWAFGHLAGKW
ncbi:uncharacterized protein EV420DRAFT_1037420 [Desarmillaria tabescens]|uniref:Uncharacterized protein n=1 Tax=Armillaria tabescens TaxID=1929756 RepID=A0AA39TV42_ARMTA|nr:uncharacterized protein EV420DRAFT_1037420 [Desarmillaria tabescens]KAK0464339.1 hypothetical protein EV420DRAFT_1037420 [Desarmillaria tabescens]